VYDQVGPYPRGQEAKLTMTTDHGYYEVCPICGEVEPHAHREEIGRGGTIIRDGVESPDPGNPWGWIETSEAQADRLLTFGLLVDPGSSPHVGDPWTLTGPDGVTTLVVAGARATSDGGRWLYFRRAQ
jgi:hypothetical protein